MNCNRPQPRLTKSRGFFYFYDKLADREVISDRAFRLITQAAAIARFGTAVLGAFSLDADEKTQI